MTEVGNYSGRLLIVLVKYTSVSSSNSTCSKAHMERDNCIHWSSVKCRSASSMRVVTPTLEMRALRLRKGEVTQASKFSY